MVTPVLSGRTESQGSQSSSALARAPCRLLRASSLLTQRPIRVLKGSPSGQVPLSSEHSTAERTGRPRLEAGQAQTRPRRRPLQYLHVEDFVRALRLACDVADFGGGLGGQRGGGVAVDSWVT